MSYKNWRNITIENEIKEYVIEICNNLLERLNCPEKIIEENGISLGSGSSGIIILLNEINKVLNIDTRELIHQYICYSEKYIYQNLGVFSLYEGITGFNYAVSIINNNTGDYANLLLELDKLFIKGVASGKCGFHTLRAFSPLIPMVCRLFTNYSYTLSIIYNKLFSLTLKSPLLLYYL